MLLFKLLLIVCLLELLMSSSSFLRRIQPLELEAIVRGIIPKLSFTQHKGSMGRVGIVGGSAEYSGAPYYAGHGSLKFGSDLAYIFCAEEAAVPIKSYSPELIVIPFYSSKSFVHSDFYAEKSRIITSELTKLHSLVIGPGLGRAPDVAGVVSDVIRQAVHQNIPLVIDADGLVIVSRDFSLIKHYKNCILTPNLVEFNRMVDSAVGELSNYSDSLAVGMKNDLIEGDEYLKIRTLCRYLGGVTIIKKGRYDLISSGEEVYEVDENGSPRRCGGQGDILAGCLGVSVGWAFAGNFDAFTMSAESKIDLSPSYHVPPIIAASLLACSVTKRASGLAFKVKGRSLTSPDILEAIGEAFESVEHIK